MDEKERAQMIAEALSGLTYREWQAVVKGVERNFHRTLCHSTVNSAKTESDVAFELRVLP